MKSLLSYNVGALLYCPANNEGIVESLINNKFGNNFSLALCLEDTINDNLVCEAENSLIQSLNLLHLKQKSQDFYMPKIFIRVRSPQQLNSLYPKLGEGTNLLTGFIAPKFSLENADQYINEIRKINSSSLNTVYFMPIFESNTIINLENRYKILYALKNKLNDISELVLNIRVGGNDLCHCFGIRRNSNESIYSIHPISNILADIITVFGEEYIVSGPVWEYYSGDNWIEGLENEIAQDRLNGFIGKTVIHPNQIPYVNEGYKVSLKDFNDATSILNWSSDTISMVSGNTSFERMNEYKTHYNWAKKIISLSKIYGIKENINS